MASGSTITITYDVSRVARELRWRLRAMKAVVAVLHHALRLATGSLFRVDVTVVLNGVNEDEIVKRIHITKGT